MIESIWRRVSPIATAFNFLVLLLFFVVFNLALFKPRVATYPEQTFDGRLRGFWPSEAKGILETFDKANKLDTYLDQERVIDLIFPIVYSLGLAVGIVGLGRAVGAPHWLVLLPLGAAIGDYLENFSIIGMILRFRATRDVPYWLAVGATIGSRVKWTLTLASLIVVLLLAVWWIVKSLRTS